MPSIQATDIIATREAVAAYPNQDTDKAPLVSGLATHKVKTAMSIAFAAEQTYQLAQRAENISALFDAPEEQRSSVYAEDVAPHNDPQFDYDKLGNRATTLRLAKTARIAAQLLVNNEIGAVIDHTSNPHYPAPRLPEGVEAAQGFKKAAAELYAQASSLLTQAGQDKAAQKLKAVSEAMAETAGDGPSPSEVIESINLSFAKGQQAFAKQKPGDPKYTERAPIQEVYDHLQALLAPLTPASRPTNKLKIVRKKDLNNG